MKNLPDKKLILRFLFAAILFLGFSGKSFSQGTWTWMHGSSSPNAPGNFGTMFIPSPTNDPPGMYKPFSWTDQQGNFWVFGGFNSIIFQCHSALWKFDPLTNMWTWMGGQSTYSAPGIYGTQGVPSTSNMPGARFSGCSWVDNQGNFWLFGGFGFDINGVQGMLSDLWRFNPVTGEWTWMKGPNTINTAGSYGSFQSPSPSNNPEPRRETMVAWTANNGDLWMYGGEGNSGVFCDMWRYSPSTNMWTWMNGLNTVNNPPVYGVFNVPNTNNTPGSRNCYARWKDAQGNFWLFGGNVNANLYHDVWMFDNIMNTWTWKGGIAGGNPQSNYGNLCEVNGYLPSARTETLCTWNDSCDRLWFMGGNNTSLLNQAVSDVWFFDPASLEFTQVCGTSLANQPGNYGTMGVPSPSNYPTSNCGSLGFTDLQGNFWLFAGLLDPTGNNTNAMWKYQRPAHCPDYNFSVTASPTTGCAPLNTSFTLSSNSSTFTYLWDFGDPNSSQNTSSLASPSHNYNDTGTFIVTILVTNNQPCNPFTDTIYDTIVVGAQPALELGNDTTICGPFSLPLSGNIANAAYLWSTGDTLQTIQVDSAGTYTLTATLNGCPVTDSITIYNLLAPDLGSDTSFCQGQTLSLDAGVWDAYNWSTGSQGQYESATATGTYWVEVFTAPCTFSDTIDITVYPTPVVSLGNDTLLCPGTVLTLDAGNPGASYAWSTSDTLQTLDVNAPGYFNVVVTQNGCSGIGDIDISYYPDIDIGPDLAFCDENSMEISAGPAGFHYLWNTGDTAHTIEIYSAGIYSVMIDNGTCILQDSIDVSGAPGLGLLFIPNAFTPNKKDGINDEFRAYGDGITYFHMDIFDRWGLLVYSSDDINQSWNGLYGNAPKPLEDVYVYRIIYRTECSGEQDIEKIGQVSLMK